MLWCYNKLIDKSEFRGERMKPLSYYDNQAMETWWEPAHEKNTNYFGNARVIVFAPDESDLHELTLFCIRVLDHNGAWDFKIEHIDNAEQNIITFKYNRTITALNAISKIRSHCVHSIKWEFID